MSCVASSFSRISPDCRLYRLLNGLRPSGGSGNGEGDFPPPEMKPLLKPRVIRSAKSAAPRSSTTARAEAATAQRMGLEVVAAPPHDERNSE